MKRAKGKEKDIERDNECKADKTRETRKKHSFKSSKGKERNPPE
jgi:hypothetical protein